MQSLQTIPNFPKRPQASSTFKPIKLVSNHFTISFSAQQPPIYLYDIKAYDLKSDQEIASDATDLLEGIVNEASYQLRTMFGKGFGHSGQGVWAEKSYTDPKTIEDISYNGKPYTLILTKIKKIDLKTQLANDNLAAQPARQCINVVIKQYYKQKKFSQWGQNSKYYDGNSSISVPDFGLEIYRGFKTSCEVFQNFVPKILMDFSCKILRTNSVYSDMEFAEFNKNKITAMLEGRTVVASYGNFRMWRISKVDFNSSPKKIITVSDKNGGQVKIPLLKYYEDQHGITIRDKDQPLLVSVDRRTRKEYLLVPELVQLAGLDDDLRSDYRVMKQLKDHTCLNPNQRMRAINDNVQPLQKFLKERNINLDLNTDVEGCVLPAPKLTFGDKSFTPEGNYIVNGKILKPVPIGKWLFVYPEVCRKNAEFFLTKLAGCLKKFNISAQRPMEVVLADTRAETLKNTIKAKIKSDIQIVVAMFPGSQKKHLYKAFKDVCCKEIGVASQAIIKVLDEKNAQAVCSKILLQMNAKLGSKLWDTARPQGLPNRTMIIGADVFHSTKIGQEKKSCIGFCASLDSDFSQFFSKISLQSRRGDEIMSNIGTLVREAVEKYFTKNKYLPDYVIFFRDGVGEGQLNYILQHETQKILDEFKLLNKDHIFKFAEVIVTKRIDDRIFTTFHGRDGTTQYQNPPAGTLVSSSIVSNRFEYILVAQDVNQGTCTPTKYTVIYDTTELPQELFWQLSYSQCYNYYNWNGSVKVPAPAQYAHKLAYLAGQTLQGDVQPQLEDKLYYL